MKNRIDSIKTILNRFITFCEPITKEDMIEARDIISSLAQERDEWRSALEEIIEDKIEAEIDICSGRGCSSRGKSDCIEICGAKHRQQIGFEYGLDLNFPCTLR